MWALDTDRVHLNHGSFGATPLPVLEAQTRLRALMEGAPTSFFGRKLPGLLDRARRATAEFVGADPSGLVFVTNASAGVSAVLRSFEHTLEPGDEIVTQSHDYNAIRQMLNFTADRVGIRVVVANIPYPISSAEQATRAVLDSVTERTKLVVIDHITSVTGLVLPIEEIVEQLEPSIPVLVDGAHGPGQVPLDLDSLGASWYTGNLHKWVCAPKGAGFLHTRDDRRADTVPTVISHAWNSDIPEGSSRYRELFDWTGTDDFTPWLTVPDAIEVIGSMESGGWPAVMTRNHVLALRGRDLIADRVGVSSAVPDDMTGSMASLPLWQLEGLASGEALSPVMDYLMDQGFETLVSVWPAWPDQVLRVSAHLYNTVDDFVALASVLTRRPISR